MGSSQSREAAVAEIKRWDRLPKDRLIFDYGRDQVKQYFQAISKVQQSPTEEELRQVVTRLKHEFQVILRRHADSVMSSNSTTTDLSTFTDSTSYQFHYEGLVVYDSPSDDVVKFLRRIAETMNSFGKLEDCIQVYKSVRHPFVGTMFRRLRLEELKAGDTKRFLSEELKMKIERWKEAAKVCVKRLFAKEKQFATQIFSGLGRTSIHEECFFHVAKDSAVSLFSFAESVSCSNQSSERLDVILILYDAILSHMPEVNDLFPLEPGKEIRNRIAATSSKLGDEVKRMLSGFQESVLKEVSRVSDDDGGKVHRLTRIVMMCIDVIMKHRKSLSSLITSRPSKTVQDRTLPDDLLRNPSSLTPLSLHLVLIIAILQLKLENKSKDYKEAALGHLFMMNNVNHIVLGIKESPDLSSMIGADYLNKLHQVVRNAIDKYLDSTCCTMLECLQEGRGYVTRCYTTRVSKTALRSCLAKFNASFERVKSVHSSWEVQDQNLRDELRRAMLDRLVQKYEHFLDKFRNHLEGARRVEVRYSVQDLKNLVEMNLFPRNQVPDTPVDV